VQPIFNASHSADHTVPQYGASSDDFNPQPEPEPTVQLV